MAQIKQAKKFFYPIMIREGHLDTFGHMNNATYLQILEEARWEIIAINGYGLQQIQEKQIGPVILEINIRFMKELKVREKVVIETQCTAADGKISKLTQEIRNENGEVCCRSVFTIAVFNLKTRKIIEPMQDWYDALGVTFETT